MKECKSLINTIRLKNQDDNIIVECMLEYLSGSIDKKEQTTDDIAYCIDVLKDCISAKYFIKVSNMLEFLHIILLLSERDELREKISSIL